MGIRGAGQIKLIRTTPGVLPAPAVPVKNSRLLRNRILDAPFMDMLQKGYLHKKVGDEQQLSVVISQREFEQLLARLRKRTNTGKDEFNVLSLNLSDFTQPGLAMLRISNQAITSEPSRDFFITVDNHLGRFGGGMGNISLGLNEKNQLTLDFNLDWEMLRSMGSEGERFIRDVQWQFCDFIGNH